MKNEPTPKFFEQINAFIRNGYAGDKDFKKEVDIISNGLKMSKLKDNYKCFRGSNYNPFEDLEIGQIGKANQFFSTSIAESGAFSGNYSFLIYGRKGTHAAYIGSISNHPNQREMLFDKDVNYRLLYKSTNFIVVETVP
jgi:hypothetical protein